ncbi:DsbA family protein, partial [Pseudomonas palleroniana]
LGRLQTAHYVEGRRIADEAVLLELAQSIGLPAQAFLAALRAVDVQGHIKASRTLLAQAGGQGFPTFALEQDGQFTLIDIGPWLGKPEAFAQWLTQVLPEQASTPSSACGLDGCSF